MTDEWLSALQALDARNPDGSTAREIAESLSTNRERAQEYIRQLVSSGAAVCSGYRKTTNVAGRVSQVPVYRLVAKRTSKSKQA